MLAAVALVTLFPVEAAPLFHLRAVACPVMTILPVADGASDASRRVIEEEGMGRRSGSRGEWHRRGKRN